MAARITRAKKKIAAARIPYRVPGPDQLEKRVSAVLEVVHLIFTTGHTAPFGDQLVRRDLTGSAIRLARLPHLLMPASAETSALLALLLAHRSAAAQDTGRYSLMTSPRIWVRRILGAVQPGVAGVRSCASGGRRSRDGCGRCLL
ncbi:DUF6596 domain-containing protein [Lentzea sp.]|uniref:DUF6596 domain-containing protein n=1 Tax=Lentzea sp. TaxID=56099 RepID=UPI002C9FC884|nr:DUF6596 domain-containing protein [Lentzea sp.]HUQ56483.1 DUF6596 domain-containing protein [Lentzea sp.]